MDTNFSAGRSVVILDFFFYHSLSLTLKCVPNKIIAPRLHCMSFSDSIIKRTDMSPLTCSQTLWHRASYMTLSRLPFPWIWRNHYLTRILKRQLNQRATYKSVSAFTSTQKMVCQVGGCEQQASVTSSAHSSWSMTGEEVCGSPNPCGKTCEFRFVAIHICWVYLIHYRK